MKKKYNPFKMWGSWIGAILVIFFLFFKISQKISEGWQIAYINPPVIFLVIFGFLLGWGIEVLLRKNKMLGLK